MNASNDQPPPEPGDNEEAPAPDSSDGSPLPHGDSPGPVAETVSDSGSPPPESEASGGSEVDSGDGEPPSRTESYAAEQAPNEPIGYQAPPLVHQTPPIPGSEPSSSVPADQLPPSSSTYNYGPPMPVAPPYPFGHPNAAVRSWAKLRFRWKRAKRPGLVLAIILSVMVLFISLVTFLARQHPEPVQAVDDYLSAIQEGKVSEALRLTNLEPERLEGDEFLTPEALNSDWDVENLELVHEGSGDFPGMQQAVVEATLQASDGTTATSEIELSAIDEDWRVEDALIEVSLEGQLSNHMAANGLGADNSESPSSSSRIALFPGVYDFSLEGVEVLEASNVSLIGIGDSLVSIGESSPKLTTSELTGASKVVLEAELAPNVDELAQSQVDEILNKCFSDAPADELEVGSNTCPYGLDSSHLTEIADPDVGFSAYWQDYEYHDYTAPEVTVEWNDDDGFILSSINDGTLEFTAEISAWNDDEPTVVTFECTYGVENLRASLDPNGGISVEGPEYSSESNAVCQVAD